MEDISEITGIFDYGPNIDFKIRREKWADDAQIK